MECPTCQQHYSETEEAQVPRILSACGHSLCHSCLTKAFFNQNIECPICNKQSNAEAVQQFTKNLALLQLMNDASGSHHAQNSFIKNSTIQSANGIQHFLQKQKPEGLGFDSISCYSMDSLGRNTDENSSSNNLAKLEQPMCQEHHKNIEAFCWNERVPLCIDCLLSSQAHKQHQVLNLQNSIDKQREVYSSVRNKIENQSHKLEQNLKNLDDHFSEQKKQKEQLKLEITSFFDQVRELVEKRQNLLLQDIEQSIEQWSQHTQAKSTALKAILDELLNFQKSQEDKLLASSQTDLELLLQLISKQEKSDQILKKIEGLSKFNKSIQVEEFDRGKEILNLNKLVQALKPNTHLKTNSIVNNTFQSQSLAMPNHQNPFRAQRDASVRATNHLMKKDAGQERKKEGSCVRKVTQSAAKDLTPQSTIQAKSIKDQPIKGLNDSKRLKKTDERPDNVTPQKGMKLNKQSQLKKESRTQLRCSSILQDYQDQPQAESLNVSKELSIEIQSKTIEKRNCGNRNKDSSLSLKKIYSKEELLQLQQRNQHTADGNAYNVNDQAIYNSISNLNPQRALNPKSLNQVGTKKRGQDAEIQMNATNAENQKESKDKLRMPSLREIRNNAKQEKKNCQQYQHQEREWTSQQQKKVDSITLARQMSSRQSLNKPSKEELDDNQSTNGASEQHSLTQRLQEDSAITADQIKLDSKKVRLDNKFGVAMVGGVGDTQVSVDVFEQGSSRWRGKYLISNFKREGYRAVNHPMNSKRIYLVGGKQNGRFVNKVYELEVKADRVIPSSMIQEFNLSIGDGYFTACSGVVMKTKPVLVVSGSIQDKQPAHAFYDFNEKKWTELSKIGPNNLSEYQIIIHDNCLYLIGGHCDKVVSKACYRYSFVSGIWEPIQNLLEGRVYFSLASATEQKLIASGGYDGEKVLQSCEMFDSEKGIWIHDSMMKLHRINHQLISVQGKTLAFGGVDSDQEILQTIEEYDPETQTWTALNIGVQSQQKGSVPSSPSKLGKRFSHSLVNIELF